MQQVQTTINPTIPPAEWLLDSEGYLADPLDWKPEFTEQRAAQEGIVLNDRHWLLIGVIRDKFIRLGALPPMRSVCKNAGLDRYHLKNQFGSCLTLWKMAGLPYPGEEAISYMQ
jgi:tRNA 2-thiouridine synthesizing protein E